MTSPETHTAHKPRITSTHQIRRQPTPHLQGMQTKTKSKKHYQQKQGLTVK